MQAKGHASQLRFMTSAAVMAVGKPPADAAAVALSISACPLQAGVAAATRPDDEPPEVFTLPRAYGFLNLADWRRDGCKAFKLASGWVGPVSCGTAAWGTLHWGRPTGSATNVPNGVVESADDWRDELSWWPEAARARPEDGAPGPPPRAGGRCSRACGAAATGPPSPHPAAPPDCQMMYRAIIAMELCEAGARSQAPRPAALHRWTQAGRRRAAGTGCLVCAVSAGERTGAQRKHACFCSCLHGQPAGARRRGSQSSKPRPCCTVTLPGQRRHPGVRAAARAAAHTALAPAAPAAAPGARAGRRGGARLPARSFGRPGARPPAPAVPSHARGAGRYCRGCPARARLSNYLPRAPGCQARIAA